MIGNISPENRATLMNQSHHDKFGKYPNEYSLSIQSIDQKPNIPRGFKDQDGNYIQKVPGQNSPVNKNKSRRCQCSQCLSRHKHDH